MRRRTLIAPLVFYAALVLLLVVAPQVLAKRDTSTTCTGTLARVTIADVTVPAGATCRLGDATVNGTVVVQGDAYFEASATKIAGSVRASGALTVFLNGGTFVSGSLLVDQTAQVFLYKTSVGGVARVSGSLAPGYGHVQLCDSAAGGIEVTGSGPDVLVGDPAAGCPGNEVKNDVVISNNDTASELAVSGNVIGGSLLVTDNVGTSPKRVMGNNVLGQVDLSGNAVPFDASGQARTP
jgi:hypothetical protein